MYANLKVAGIPENNWEMSIFVRAFSLFLLVGTLACSAEVVRDLPENEANRVLEELVRANIPARKVRTDARRNVFGVEVPQGSLSRALAILSSRDALLPHREGMSAFTKNTSPFLTSSIERQIRYFSALCEELERTLESLSGVQRARVHLAMPPFRDATLSLHPARTTPTRASVLLRVREREFDLQPEEVQAIVAGAVSDLPRTDVSVVIQPVVETSLPSQDLVWVGPLLLSPGGIWGISLFLIAWLVLTVWLVFFWFSSRHLRRQPIPAPEEEKPASP